MKKSDWLLLGVASVFATVMIGALFLFSWASLSGFDFDSPAVTDPQLPTMSANPPQSDWANFNGPCGYSACEEPTLIIHGPDQNRMDEWVAIEWNREDPEDVPNVTWGTGVQPAIDGHPVCQTGPVSETCWVLFVPGADEVDNSFSFENHPCKPEDYEPGGPCNLRGESPEESAIRAKCRLRATATVPTPKEWEALDCSRFESGESAGQDPDVH